MVKITMYSDIYIYIYLVPTHLVTACLEPFLRGCFFRFFSIWLDAPHLTNEHRTKDCIAS